MATAKRSLSSKILSWVILGLIGLVGLVVGCIGLLILGVVIKTLVLFFLAGWSFMGPL